MRRLPPERRAPLTAEDLDILATPTPELKERAMVMSFDLEEFDQRISDDDWSAVIKGHLYLDHILFGFLNEALPNPSELDIQRMGFSSKLQLVFALGLLPKDLGACYSNLNPIIPLTHVRPALAA
ncbi:MAG: hypothetical protein Q7U20_01415 [Caulobacter sp.]|nr:hypothetical protein [Caulobacter sp.]